MAHNYLEQLVAEWLEFKGFFVRRNVLVGKLTKGGFECELDVVAFDPRQKRLLHIEPSMDADTWGRREERFTKKFAAGRAYIPALFEGLELPAKIEQFALLGFASKKNHADVGGGVVIVMEELLPLIIRSLRTFQLSVPEQFALLRTLQFTTQHRIEVVQALNEPLSNCATDEVMPKGV